MKAKILRIPFLGYLKDGDGDGNSQPHKGVKASANSDVMYFFTSAQDGDPSQDDVRLCLGDDLKKAQDHRAHDKKGTRADVSAPDWSANDWSAHEGTKMLPADQSEADTSAHVSPYHVP
ncbi:hypothetical protein Tco_0431241 [Tanacetum coccineum]